MKKILSILICVVLGISSAWADSTTDKKSITIKATASPASGGTVLVATKTATTGESLSAAFTKWNWNDFVSDPNGAGVTSQHTGKSRYYEWTYWTFGGDKTSSKTTGIYYRVNAYPNEGYYFQKWTGLVNVTGTTDEEGEEIVESTVNTYQPDGYTYLIHKKAKTYYYNDDKTHNITAYFKPVTVDKMQIDGEDVVSKTLNTTDKLSYKETTITFTVTGADNMNDFVSDKVVLSGDSRFTIQSSTLSGNTVTVVVRFTDDDRHVVDGTLPKATVTLTSKGDNSSTKTATITATSDLTPYFTVTPSLCDLTPNDPVEDGNEVSATLITTATTGYTTVVSLASWNATFTDPDVAAQLGFSISNETTNSPTVKFTPTLASINKANVTTEVCITSTYKDNSNPQKTLTDKQCVTISVDAGKIFTINTVSDAVMDFDIVDYSETNNPVDKSFPVYTTMELSDFTITENLNGITYATNVVGQGSATDNIVVTAQSNLVPNTYVSRIDFAETGDDLHASLTVNVPIKLAKPVVTATVGLGQKIQLDWQDVYGATSYIVKSGETILATIVPDGGVQESAYTVTNIAGRLLNTGFEYSFTVTAIYEPNVFGNRVSDEVTATPTAPSTITSTTDLDIYTGTETAGSYPYHKDGKRLVDLSAAFNNGVAAFDQLYVFGLTTGDANNNITAPTKTTNSNAVTPCYIYNKIGKDYVLSQTIENVNVATKPSAFNITASGQKIYFTGYAPYASCGSTWEENGVFYINGQNNIDIYLNDLELYARPKTELGDYPALKTFEVNDENVMSYLGMDEFQLDIDIESILPPKVNFKGLNVYAQGSGSAFCLYPNNSSFNANVHLLGDNVLQSARGMDIHVDVSIGMTLNSEADQHSAPIQIIHNSKSVDNKTTLTIDDKWISDNRTNGKLNLATVAYRAAPTIDLGTEKTTLVINGGQLFLANSFNTSTTYDVSYAISYRYYSIKDGLAKMYGLGSDQPGATVLFKDGTINCRSLPPSITESTDVNVQNIYKKLFHNPTSMKCPANTKIDGGTFNCDVLACNSSTSKGGSPTNSNGSPLCMVDIPVKTQLANGLVETLIDGWMNYAAQLPDGANTNDLSYYGIESMNPEQITDVNGDPSTVVHMMLPSDKICFKEEITTSWVMCYPRLDIITNAGVQATNELGGDKDVPFSIHTDDDTKLVTIKKTSKLLFASMDDITINSVGSYQAPGNSTVDLKEGGLPANILNVNNYVIYDKVYMLMPVVANDWKLFSPPFDVSNVYIIESYPEQKLIEAFSNGAKDKKGNPIITGEKIAEARTAQAHRMIDLLYQWIWENDVTPGKADVWSNDPKYKPMGSFYSVGSFVQFWYNMYDASERPVIEQLYHYKSSNEGYPTGKSRWDANFYLYEVDGESWGIDDNGLQTSWKEVSTISVPRDIKGTNKVIMQKGHVYSMSFPYTIVNSEVHDPSTVWDYWTGKYILLEGYPAAENNIDSDGDDKLDSKGQIIAGANSLDEITSEFTEEGKAKVRGNYTFYSGEVTSDNIFVVNGKNENLYKDGYDHNVFVNYDYAWLYPADCFVYAKNAPASPSGMPRRISSINPISGEITYRDETTTSLPTIGGNKQMMVYNIEGGVGIVPVVEQQVSIYNAAGQLITSQYLTDEVHIPLPSGIYLITGANDQFKAVVK